MLCSIVHVFDISFSHSLHICTPRSLARSLALRQPAIHWSSESSELPWHALHAYGSALSRVLGWLPAPARLLRTRVPNMCERTHGMIANTVVPEAFLLVQRAHAIHAIAPCHAAVAQRACTTQSQLSAAVLLPLLASCYTPTWNPRHPVAQLSPIDRTELKILHRLQ